MSPRPPDVNTRPATVPGDFVAGADVVLYIY